MGGFSHPVWDTWVYNPSVRVFGKKFSNWWLALLVPVLIACLPLLLMGFFVANDLAGALIGPPAIWNRTFHSPPRSDLAGQYVETERRWDRSTSGPGAEFELRADGSMRVSGLPQDAITSTCTLSGSGSWTGPNDDQQVDLIVDSDGSPGSCPSGAYQFLQLTGHSKPYGFYWVLGDPDSGTGIWFKRR